MRHLLLLAVVPFVLQGCSKSENPVSSAPFQDTTISVPFNRSVPVPGTGFSLKFEQLPYDGRLPSGTVNPNWWTNTARVCVIILPLNIHMQLYISGEIPDSGGVHFDGAPVVCQGYIFRLAQLTPLPTTHLVPPPESLLVASIEIRDTAIAPQPDTGSFPLSVGNRWVYLDSTFQDDTLASITTDTISIYDEYTDQNGHWWLFSTWMDPFGRVVAGKADTLYSQQDAYAPLPPGSPMYFPSKEIIPPVGDSSRYMIIVGGDMVGYRDVRPIASPVTTPAGTFGLGWRYDTDMGYEKTTQILVPGVGFVYLESRLVDFMAPHVTRRLWLTAYYVN